MTIIIILFGAAIVLALIIAYYKVSYLGNDKNFQEGAKWPKWLIKDAEEWNRKHPDEIVQIRK